MISNLNTVSNEIFTIPHANNSKLLIILFTIISYDIDTPFSSIVITSMRNGSYVNSDFINLKKVINNACNNSIVSSAL